jgi:hypothetical protein
MKVRVVSLAIVLLALIGFGGKTTVPSSAKEAPAQAVTAGMSVDAESGGEENTMRLLIGDREVPVTWEENASVEELQDLCPLTIPMSMYGGFEQVGPIGTSLPGNDMQTTTSAGDIVLYSGNQIVVFYGSNSWAYTRLGHITDQSAEEMAQLLGNGDVCITLSTDN